MAVGSATVTTVDWGSMKKTNIDWTSNSSGAVSGVTTKDVSGIVWGVTFVPDSGATQPTNAYDVVLNSSHGVDVLQGRGSNLSNAAASTSLGQLPVSGPLTLGVTNAGSSNGGQVELHWR